MDKQPIFHVEEVIVPDRKIWPTDHSQMVTRYALVDEQGVVWLNGHAFGFLENMIHTDRSSSDCRYLLRESTYEALRDSGEWYHFEKGDDGRYKQVENGR